MVRDRRKADHYINTTLDLTFQKNIILLVIMATVFKVVGQVALKMHKYGLYSKTLAV